MALTSPVGMLRVQSSQWPHPSRDLATLLNFPRSGTAQRFSGPWCAGPCELHLLPSSLNLHQPSGHWSPTALPQAPAHIWKNDVEDSNEEEEEEPSSDDSGHDDAAALGGALVLAGQRRAPKKTSASGAQHGLALSCSVCAEASKARISVGHSPSVGGAVLPFPLGRDVGAWSTTILAGSALVSLPSRI